MFQYLNWIWGKSENEHIKPQQYDVIIIGGGPAGLSAGLYTARANLSSLLIDKGPLGGQLSWVKHIDNYPGFPDGISGPELTELMKEQASKHGLKIEQGSVIDLGIDEAGLKEVKTDRSNYLAKTLIVTTGLARKRESVDGEEKFQGVGVSYCATCDGPFFKDKSVAIVGGGDEALEEAIFLTKYANQVTIIHADNALSAKEELRNIAREKDNVSFMLNSKVTKIAGSDKVELLEAMDLNTGETISVPVEGVFLYIGTRAARDFLSQILEMDQKGYIVTDQEMKTSMDGIFAAGDVRYKRVRQIATAVGDAVTAATSVRKYIQSIK